MKKILAILLTVLMAFTVVVPVSAAETDVAAIGETTYATLAEAITAAASGDTIKLLGDVTENVTIGKNLTLDGDGKQYKGQITIKNVTATIQNVNFVDSYIYKNKKTKAANITVKGCSFEGSLNDGYAMRLDNTSKITIEDCTAKDVDFGFLYVASSSNTINVKNVTIDGAAYGFHIVYNNSTTFENVTIKNATYGVRLQSYAAKTVTFKNCSVDAETPVEVVERNATTQTFVFKGENDFGTDDLTFGSTLVNAKVDVAKVGTETYETLSAAVEAAADGDTVTVLADHEIASKEAFLSKDYPEWYVFAEAIGKKVTIDLNGKVITVNPELDNTMLAIVFAGTDGEVILKDSSEAQTGAINVNVAEATKSYSIFTVDGGKFTIEGGNYYLNRADSWSMIYAGHHKEFTVTGGNFVLGNGDSKTWGNGETYPWIANVGGDGAGAIEISGGTYNIDPEHYHGETYFPGCYAPVEEDGKWIVKLVHTPGDAATCQAAQTCTVCGEEVDAIKEHTYEVYVSNGDATCTADGTKTAECIYACGEKDTVADEGSAKGHTPGAAATCQAAQVCTVCGVELDAIKEHTFGEYVSDNNATCEADGTKTAECIYACGTTDTVTDKGTMGDHADIDGDGNCDGCSAEFCDTCGKVHKSWINALFCLIVDFVRLVLSFASSVK